MVDIPELSKQVLGAGDKADMVHIELVDRVLDSDDFDQTNPEEESVA